MLPVIFPCVHFSFLWAAWDSESDFQLQAVDRGLADLSDEPSKTSAEEQNDGDGCGCEKCTVHSFMFRLLGRLNGGLISADCSIGPGGGLDMGGG